MSSRGEVSKETDKQIAIELIKNGYVSHRVNQKTKDEQVKITDKGLVALKLLRKLKSKK